MQKGRSLDVVLRSSYREMKFSVNIKPKAKERPRFARGHVYTPKGTKDYENVIAMSAKAAGVKPTGKACAVFLTFIFKFPRKTKKGEAMHCTKRPDLDNCTKAVTDALNGIAYDDDSQIVWLQASKKYGESDMVEVTINEL